MSRPCGALDCEANTYTGVVHTHTESIMRKSARSMHTASTCTAGSSSGGERAGKAYRDVH